VTLRSKHLLMPRITGMISSMYQVLHARRGHIIRPEVFGNGPDVNLGTKRKVFLQLAKMESLAVVHTNAFFQNKTGKPTNPLFSSTSPHRVMKSKKVTNKLITNELVAHAREMFDILRSRPPLIRHAIPQPSQLLNSARKKKNLKESRTVRCV
jgi:hypothetical protein